MSPCLIDTMFGPEHSCQQANCVHTIIVIWNMFTARSPAAEPAIACDKRASGTDARDAPRQSQYRHGPGWDGQLEGELPGVASEVVYQGRMRAVVSMDSLLASRERIRLADLARFNHTSLRRFFSLRRTLDPKNGACARLPSSIFRPMRIGSR